MGDTRTPVKIAAFSILVSTGLAWLLMRWLGTPGIALGSSIGAFVNTVLHLRDLSGRLGSVLRGTDWRGFGMKLGAGVVAGAAATRGPRLTGSSPPPSPRGSRV